MEEATKGLLERKKRRARGHNPLYDLTQESPPRQFSQKKIKKKICGGHTAAKKKKEEEQFSQKKKKVERLAEAKKLADKKQNQEEI